MDNVDEDNRGPFSYPYGSSYGFAASSWDLRRNLTETFNQHVGVETIASGAQKNTPKDKSTSQQASFVGNKIAQFEKNSGRPTNVGKKPATAAGKPPKPPQLRGSETRTGNQKRCMSVFLRIRPPKDGMINTIEILPGDPPTKVRTHAPRTSNAAKMNREGSSRSMQSDSPMVAKEFDFQEVFGPQKDNEDVYSKIVAPTVDRMFPCDASNEPESGLLFAYGATNAGKTYSILGKNPSGHGALANEKHRGIVPRAIQDVLGHIEKLRLNAPEQTCDLYMSIMEIHNENIYDLLEEQESRHPAYLREPLKLRESKKHTFIRGLVKRPVNDVGEGLRLARQAHSKRHTASNNLNSDSSRSHCVFQLQIIQRNAKVPTLREGSAAVHGYTTDEEASQIFKQNPTTLWIVDLAGSERSKRTNVGTLRQKEASLINKSLMNLMRCLSVIRENQSGTCSSQVIPFRESKLTHLFMPVLTGRSASSISMIVNVNPAAPEYDETNHVLSYASEAKMVQIEDAKMPADGPKLGAGEYGYNGRPVKKASAVSKMTKLMKKLSPKKLMKRGDRKDEKRRLAGHQEERKRKAAMVPSSRVSSSNAVSTNSNVSKDVPKAKKMRVAKSSVTNSGASGGASTSDSTVKSLKMALSIAHAEVELLKSENAKLAEEITQVEAKTRLELIAEMDEQLEHTKQYYTDIIERMKAQSRQSVGVFEKRSREAKATEQIDLLLFKVEECEEEMQRQADSHGEELSTLQRHYEETNAAQQREIELLKERLRQQDATDEGDKQDVVEAQRKKIVEQEQELETLKKSKSDLIEAYEKLLADEEEDLSSEEDDNSPENEEASAASSNVNSAFQAKQPRYMTRNQSTQKWGLKPHGARPPLLSISGNGGDA